MTLSFCYGKWQVNLLLYIISLVHIPCDFDIRLLFFCGTISYRLLFTMQMAIDLVPGFFICISLYTHHKWHHKWIRKNEGYVISFKMQSRFFHLEVKDVGNLNHKVILKQRLILISAQSRVTKLLTNGSPSSRGLLLLKIKTAWFVPELHYIM